MLAEEIPVHVVRMYSELVHVGHMAPYLNSKAVYKVSKEKLLLDDK